MQKAADYSAAFQVERTTGIEPYYSCWHINDSC